MKKFLLLSAVLFFKLLGATSFFVAITKNPTTNQWFRVVAENGVTLNADESVTFEGSVTLNPILFGFTNDSLLGTSLLCNAIGQNTWWNDGGAGPSSNHYGFFSFTNTQCGPATGSVPNVHCGKYNGNLCRANYKFGNLTFGSYQDETAMVLSIFGINMLQTDELDIIFIDYDLALQL